MDPCGQQACIHPENQCQTAAIQADCFLENNFRRANQVARNPRAAFQDPLQSNGRYQEDAILGSSGLTICGSKCLGRF